MRLRIERRTRIFDEVCELTARYSLKMSGDLFDVRDPDFLTSVACVDRKIWVHFSPSAYKVWRGAEKMIATGTPRAFSSTDFSEAARAALEALGDELK